MHGRSKSSDVLAIAVSLLSAISFGASNPNESSSLPQTPVRAVKEDHFGTVVVDPYRWLEDTKNPEVVAWLKAQNEYTRAVLDRLPGRDKLQARIHELNDAGTAVAGVQLEGKRVFYFKTFPGTDNRRLFVRDGFAGKERSMRSSCQQGANRGD